MKRHGEGKVHKQKYSSLRCQRSLNFKSASHPVHQKVTAAEIRNIVMIAHHNCRGSTLNMAKPGPEHILVNCKHIFEQDKQPSYVSVLVLLLSLRYYISLWNPIGS